jgi:hypothetical protein
VKTCVDPRDPGATGRPRGLDCEDGHPAGHEVPEEIAVVGRDLYDAFVNDPGYLETPGTADSLFLMDGLHSKLATGDDLIAAEIANAIPEPSTALLVASGFVVLAARRSPRHR